MSSSILLFLRKKIENKVENLTIISDLDIKIRWSYNRLLSQLKYILYFILGFQCFKIFYHFIVYQMQGQCDYQTYNYVGNSFIYFITDPNCCFIKSCVFLYIFWRRKINLTASNNIRASNIKKSFIPVGGTNSPKWRQSNSMVDTSDILRKSKSVSRHKKGN